jgi:DNA processing protein
MHHQFIERNRIIAALSDILVITEAAENSGSLHTARFALELGKTIMAVPGQINSPYSKGTNKLIHTGAIPILEATDVLDQLGLKELDAVAYLPENKAEAVILKLLKQSSLSHNELLNHSELDTPVFQTHLTMLELKGVVEVTSGIWRLK